ATARDLVSGREQSIQVNPAGGLTREEIERMIAEADRHRREDAARRELRLLANRLEGLLYTNERVFKEFGNLLEESVRSEVKEALERGRRLLESDDANLLQEGITVVNGAARHLTQVMLMDPRGLLMGLTRGEKHGGAA
ncbi:MAG: Hsp70 family protein, partial [Acidobacteriota bacterium]